MWLRLGLDSSHHRLGRLKRAVFVYVFLSHQLVPFSNPGLRELPPELGQLGNLWQLDIEDLNISNVPAEVRKEGRASSALFHSLP